MINANTNSSENMPFLLQPAAKDYLWGGNRLNEDFEKQIDISPLAETWECSTHPDGPSIIASGRYKGQTLAEVLKKHPEFLGTHPKGNGELPILVKLIDANQDLSVQVHPDDEYAKIHEFGNLGKAEMWYVLDAKKNASLVYGFNTNMSKKLVSDSIRSGTIEKYLKKVPVAKDDIFFIEPGTVHAIGKGVLIAEIQENSNLTYRLYDYNRMDKNGNLRKLHIDKALEVIDLKSSLSVRQPMRLFQYKNGCSEELLCRCKYFEVRKKVINTQSHKKMYNYKTDSSTFQILLCIDGCGTLICANNQIHFFKGDCIFIPANSKTMKIHGITTLLNIRC